MASSITEGRKRGATPCPRPGTPFLSVRLAEVMGGELGGGPCRSELGVLQGTQPETDTELLGARVSQEPWELEDL